MGGRTVLALAAPLQSRPKSAKCLAVGTKPLRFAATCAARSACGGAPGWPNASAAATRCRCEVVEMPGVRGNMRNRFAASASLYMCGRPGRMIMSSPCETQAQPCVSMSSSVITSYGTCGTVSSTHLHPAAIIARSASS